MFKFSNIKNDFQKRVLFVGIPDMAYICLDGLGVSGVNIVGVVGPKKNHPTYSMFKSFVQSRHLNYVEYDELDDIFFIDKIKNLKADIAVVCSFNYKIPKVLLNAVKDGFVNIHPSLLPQYRGPNPYTAAILNGEQETGVTLHFMDEKFDTGDIIAQKKVSISKYETMGTLFNRTNIVALDMLLDTLRKYETSDLSRQKQPEGNFIVSKTFSEENSLISFDSTAREINNFIKSLNPFILARTNFRGTFVKIFTADVEENETANEFSYGQIAEIKDDKFYIATKCGLLAPTSMQFGSFFAGTSKEFIKILNPRIGEKFQ